MQFLWSSDEVQIIRNSYEFHMYFMRTVYEPHVNLFVLHGYNILTSLALRYEVHMNFIRTACEFIWINLIQCHMQFTRSSFELHVKFIWTFYQFHMNKFDVISYEIRKKFIWTSYEVHTKFKINSYVDHTNSMWSYAYMVSYGLHMNEPPGPS